VCVCVICLLCARESNDSSSSYDGKVSELFVCISPTEDLEFWLSRHINGSILSAFMLEESEIFVVGLQLDGTGREFYI
jgi:hypothetical protein